MKINNLLILLLAVLLVSCVNVNVDKREEAKKVIDETGKKAGVYRGPLKVSLPAKPHDDEELAPRLAQNNILEVRIDKNDKVGIKAGLLEDRILMEKYGIADVNDVPLDKLRIIAKDFITNKEKLAEYPCMTAESFSYNEYDREGNVVKSHTLPSGKYYDVAMDHVIAFITDRETSYKFYFEVMNELYGAYNELREEMAQAEYGMKFAELDVNRQGVVREYYKYRIYEAEPAAFGK
jgi:hypothetical protein